MLPYTEYLSVRLPTLEQGKMPPAGGDGGRRSPEHSRISKEHRGRQSRCLGGPTSLPQPGHRAGTPPLWTTAGFSFGGAQPSFCAKARGLSH